MPLATGDLINCNNRNNNDNVKQMCVCVSVCCNKIGSGSIFFEHA